MEPYFNFFYNFFQAFIKVKEKNRLVILKGKFDDKLWNDFKREQVEKKFGGDVRDITQFW